LFIAGWSPGAIFSDQQVSRFHAQLEPQPSAGAKRDAKSFALNLVRTFDPAGHVRWAAGSGFIFIERGPWRRALYSAREIWRGIFFGTR